MKKIDLRDLIREGRLVAAIRDALLKSNPQKQFNW